LKHQKVYFIEDLIEDWLWKPICNDGTIGINPQLAWNEIENNKKYI